MTGSRKIAAVSPSTAASSASMSFGCDEGHARHERRERLAIGIVSGQRQRAERASVEALFQRDELGLLRSPGARTSAPLRSLPCRCCRRTRAGVPRRARASRRGCPAPGGSRDSRRAAASRWRPCSALTSCGCLCPSTFTAMPPSRSQYSRPSASMRRAPLPSRGWNGVRAYVFTRNALSRSSTACGDSSCSNKGRTSRCRLSVVGSGCGDGDLADSRAERGECGLQLRLHAAGDRGAFEHRFDTDGVEVRHDVAVVIEQAGDIGDEVQRRRAESNGDRRGGGVGVDVEQRAVRDPARSSTRRAAGRRRASPAGERRLPPVTWPTLPRSTPSIGSCCSAMSVPPSHPLMPAARTPRAVSSATSILFTWPPSTETTICNVASSVMRSPACVRFSIPAFASAASMCFPPPCTSTSSSPAFQRSTIAVTAFARRCGSSRSDPPSLITFTAVPPSRDSRTSD